MKPQHLPLCLLGLAACMVASVVLTAAAVLLWVLVGMRELFRPIYNLMPLPWRPYVPEVCGALAVGALFVIAAILL